VATSSAEPDPEIVAALRAAGCVFAEEEAALLEAGAREGGDLPLMLARRVAGEPLEQVLGWAEFCGLRIKVVPGVFVPRRRTEALVELAVLAAGKADRRPVVVDLCCGTGAIGVAVASVLPAVELHATDMDPDAVACARLNIVHGHVHEGDLYDALPDHLRGRVDVIVVNAPYVPTEEIAMMPPEARDHEHRIALDGGADGLDVHRRVAAGAPEWLGPGGTLLIETSREQAELTAAACADAGLAPYLHRFERVASTVVRAISVDPDSSGTMSG
jgi:release factor glutamine methyltransferase